MSNEIDTPVRWPDHAQIQAIIREAHAERSRALAAMLASLFRRHRDGGEAEPAAALSHARGR